MIRRILAPLDVAPVGEAKLPVAEEYARAFGAEVLLLHVLSPRAMVADAVSAAEAVARTYLDMLAAHLSGAGVQAETHVRSGPPAATIVEEARAQAVDLIILGSNVRPPLSKVVIGSVADQVVRDAPCPVLLVRPSLRAGAAPPLRSFDEDARRAGPLSRRSVGPRTVELARIIGSVGRARDLGADLRPLKRSPLDDARFERIRRALVRGDPLPPVELYKLGFGYYVLDGHHRVAAARQLGQLEIEARVTEFLPLRDPRAARTFAERRAFERSTGLTHIGAARPESYAELAALIEAYRQEHGIADYAEAARRWDTEVFRPLWRRARRHRLTRYFPGELTADVIARLSAWRAAADGALPDLQAALDGFRASVLAERQSALAGRPQPAADSSRRPASDGSARSASEQ